MWLEYSVTRGEVSYAKDIGEDPRHTFLLDLLSLFNFLNLRLLLFHLGDAFVFVRFGMFWLLRSRKKRVL